MNVLGRLQRDDNPVLDFSSYLFAAARNESYALMRRRNRTQLSDEPPERAVYESDVETDPERAVLLRDSQESVRLANAQLAPRHREVLALREVGGRSYEEIGQIMGISENAAAQLIWRRAVEAEGCAHGGRRGLGGGDLRGLRDGAGPDQPPPGRRVGDGRRARVARGPPRRVPEVPGRARDDLRGRDLVPAVGARGAAGDDEGRRARRGRQRGRGQLDDRARGRRGERRRRSRSRRKRSKRRGRERNRRGRKRRQLEPARAEAAQPTRAEQPMRVEPRTAGATPRMPGGSRSGRGVRRRPLVPRSPPGIFAAIGLVVVGLGNNESGVKPAQAPAKDSAPAQKSSSSAPKSTPKTAARAAAVAAAPIRRRPSTRRRGSSRRRHRPAPSARASERRSRAPRARARRRSPAASRRHPRRQPPGGGQPGGGQPGGGQPGGVTGPTGNPRRRPARDNPDPPPGTDPPGNPGGSGQAATPAAPRRRRLPAASARGPATAADRAAARPGTAACPPARAEPRPARARSPRRFRRHRLVRRASPSRCLRSGLAKQTPAPATRAPLGPRAPTR